MGRAAEVSRAAHVRRAAPVGRAAMVRRAASAASGFTLLEMIVTLAVLALAIAVVTPAIGRGTDSLRARAEVASFAATLRHAREQAIATQRPYRVSVDAENHRILVTTLPSPGSVSGAGSTSATGSSTDPGAASSTRFGSSRAPSPPASRAGSASSNVGSRPPGSASTNPANSVLSTAAEPVTVTRTLSPTFVIESAEPSEVIFDIRGGASGGDFKLSSGSLVYRVTVDRLSGRVRSIRE